MLGEPVEFLDDLAQNFRCAVEPGVIEQGAQRGARARFVAAAIGE